MRHLTVVSGETSAVRAYLQAVAPCVLTRKAVSDASASQSAFLVVSYGRTVSGNPVVESMGYADEEACIVATSTSLARCPEESAVLVEV